MKWLFFLLIGFSLTLVYASTLNNNALAKNDVLVDKIERNDGWGVTAIDPENSKVYVTNFKSTTVTIIDGNTNKQISEIEVGSSPYGIGINTKTKILFVAREHNDTLAIVDTRTGEVIKNLELPDPYDIAVNSKTNKAYVTSDVAHTVFVVDGNENEIMTTFSVDKPCGVAVNEATNKIYVTSETTNKVHVFDGSDNKLVTILDVGKSPRGVVANPNTNMVYVTNQLSGTVDVIDGTKNEKIDTISVGTTPRRIVANPDTNTIYVSNQISNSISVIDGVTNKVIDSIPVEQPYELMINPKTNKLYSTYYGYPMLSIINDVIREPDKSDLESIIGVMAAGALAAGIAFFITRKKKLESKQ